MMTIIVLVEKSFCLSLAEKEVAAGSYGKAVLYQFSHRMLGYLCQYTADV